MTTERPGAPRLVVDTGVYVSAAISGMGPPAQLIEAALEGQAVLVVSPLLLAELREVLARDRFRRWISLEDAETFIQGIELLAEMAEDPPESVWPRVRPVCRDPDDDYLVALAETAHASLLVSGDGDLLAVDRPGLDVRRPRAALEAVHYRHPWGRAYIPAEDETASWRQAEAEGHDQVLKTVSVFLAVLDQSNAEELLHIVVTPESLPEWLAELAAVREMAADRGMATRPDYPAPDVAYVKLPPDPGDTIRATAHVALEGAIIASLQRRPELPDSLGLGGWRVHGLGWPALPEDMPSVAAGPTDPTDPPERK